MRAAAVTGLCAVALAGCGARPEPAARTAQPVRATRTPARPALCGQLRTRVLGRVRDARDTELSGLARSRAHPGVLYADNDSGAPPAVTQLRADGTVLAHTTVTGAQATDWEDVATLRTQARGAELLVGDLGDNAAQRAGVRIYRVAEPAPGATATAPAAALDLRYPDGPHDAEALVADPVRDELLIVTKAAAGGRAYTVDAAGAHRTLRRGPRVRLGFVTAGDLSADGRVLALRTYSALVLWRRHGGEPLARTLGRAPTCVARAGLAAEGQGEALALDRHGRSALTVPEGADAAIRRYAPRDG